MNKVIIGSALLFISNTIYSQSKYQIQYDYQKESIKYLKLDKSGNVIDTLNRPNFKKNIPVEIKVLNVNPFAVEVSSSIKEENHDTTEGGYNITSLLGGITKFSSKPIPINVAPGASESNGSGAPSRGTRSASEYNKVAANVDAIRTTLLSNIVNPNMTKDEIIQNLKKVSTDIIDGNFQSDPNDNYYLFLSELQSIVNNSAASVEDYLNLLSSSYLTQDTSGTTMTSRGEQYNALLKTKKEVSESVATTQKGIDEIKELYSKLEAATFEKTFDYVTEADKANINLKFLQSKFANSLDDDAEQTVVKERKIKISARGGLKINTSVAITLNNFGSKSKDYYISEDSIIGADENKNFTPSIATMINFYPYATESINIGGSFGVSIPISDQIKGINFLLGPSIFLGNSNRISLSGGIAYGPVQKLTNGLAVGNETQVRDLSNYIKNVYEVGYYFGISFSLANIK